MYVIGGSAALAKTCKFRQQLRQLKELRKKKKK
jgi:hypothetical protein